MRARAAAQAVEVHRRQRSVQRVPDLAARDALAEADDPPVVAVGVDQLAALVGPLGALADVRHRELRRRSGPGLEPQPGRAELLAHVLRDRHRGGQARGANAAHAGVALGRVHAELVVHVLGGGAQAGVHRGHLVLEQPGHDPRALGAQVREPLGRGLGVVLSPHVLGGRAEHHVAEHGGRNQHALRDLGGHREDDVLHERARELVEDDQLAAPRRDREALVAEHAVELVGAQARRVHQVARAQGTARGGEAKAALAESLDSRDRARAAEVTSAQQRFGRVGERRGERADERLVGHLERPAGAWPELGFAPVELVHAELGDLAVAVCVGALDDAGELGQLFVVPRYEQRARALDGDADPVGVVGQQPEPARHQPCLERAGLGVEAGVEQRGVRLARAGPHVRPGLQQGHTQVEVRQLARNGAARPPPRRRWPRPCRAAPARAAVSPGGYFSVARAWPRRPDRAPAGSRRGKCSPGQPRSGGCDRGPR